MIKELLHTDILKRSVSPTIGCRAPAAVVALGFVLLSGGSARAGIAYGSINNFDTVNDTGSPCHGFEIELDDIHSAEITYTYDWNHYGTPQITEDSADPLHPKVYVRYRAVWTNTDWSAYTAVPGGPIAPTQGHQFTNPSLNFGGEHFGVGYRTPPSLVKYNWLVEGAGHTLVLGPSVSVSTPAFTYNPPAGGVPAQVQAAIVPPPAPIVYEFGDATWVKEIRTSSHTNSEVRLRDLVSPDPEHPGRKDWRNGEPDEVEVEWQILQIDTLAANGGANGELVAAAEPLNQGDEIVTRRYEFYKYTGPFDPETHEARAQSVAADGIHGTLTYSNAVVVGQYLGAQMSAVAAAPPLGLIDHLPDGEANTPYPNRTLVIAGDTNFTASTSGSLPDGMSFDPSTGQVSGTPSAAGVFLFSVSLSSSNSPMVTKRYPLAIAAAGIVLPPHSSVDTGASPPAAGNTGGDGVYTNGTVAAVTATANPGFSFLNWTENGVVVSAAARYEFTNAVNRSLVANFVIPPNPQIRLQSVGGREFLVQWSTNYTGFVLQENWMLETTNWIPSTNAISVAGADYQARVSATGGWRFFRLVHP